MKRLVIMTIIKLCREAILLATFIGIVIGVNGITKKWGTSLPYSNVFFIAGALVIIAGTSTRLAAGEDWNIFQLLSAESFRGMSSGERADVVIKASSSLRLVILV